MIFTDKKLRAKVLAGQKIETRRIVKPGEKECRYRPGRTYSVQSGKGKAGEGRIEIIAVDRQRLGELDYAAARREGFKTTNDFFAYWRELHGSCDQRTEVWVILFVRAGEELRLLGVGTSQSSLGYVHDEKLALGADTQRAGSLRAGPLQEPEPEAIDEETQARFCAEGRERFEDQRREQLVEREVRSLSVQVRKSAAQIARSGVDPKPLIEGVRELLRRHGPAE